MFVDSYPLLQENITKLFPSEIDDISVDSGGQAEVETKPITQYTTILYNFFTRVNFLS